MRGYNRCNSEPTPPLPCTASHPASFRRLRPSRRGSRQRHRCRRGHDPFRRDGQSLCAESDHRPAGLRRRIRPHDAGADRRAPDGEAGGPHRPRFCQGRREHHFASTRRRPSMWTGRCGLIRDEGCKAGLVFNPATPLDYLDHVMDKLDLVLIMSVNPGFGGQAFIPTCARKTARARERIDSERARHLAGGGRRRQGRQHCRDRACRRGYFRRRLGDIRHEGLSGDGRRDAHGTGEGCVRAARRLATLESAQALHAHAHIA